MPPFARSTFLVAMLLMAIAISRYVGRTDFPIESCPEKLTDVQTIECLNKTISFTYGLALRQIQLIDKTLSDQISEALKRAVIYDLQRNCEWNLEPFERYRIPSLKTFRSVAVSSVNICLQSMDRVESKIGHDLQPDMRRVVKKQIGKLAPGTPL